jgi:cyclopropane-fatty-acyl-phospholipid synthase
MALYLAGIAGADATGLTLSQEQLKVAQRRASEQGLSSHVRFRLEDYRVLSETFDRIVSVGMFEHVGLKNYDTYFDVVRRSLKDDGIAVIHSIGRMDGRSAMNPWFAKYIFPGSYVPTLSEVFPSIENAHLIVTDVEILRLHYADTLGAWRRRFLARRADAAALLGERFCRMWEFYLSAGEAGFRYGGLMVFQVQLAKSIDAVPRTRDYIAFEETRLRQRENATADQTIAAE